MKRLLATAFAVVVGATSAVVSVQPAAAALPTCYWVQDVFTAHSTALWAYNYSLTDNCENKPGNSNTPGFSYNLAVLFLQIDLNQCYGRGLVEDGLYGNNTWNAVKWVQQNVLHINADGWAGPNTRKRMTHYVGQVRPCETVPQPPVAVDP